MLQLAPHVAAGQRLKAAMKARHRMLAGLAKTTGLSVRTCCTLQQGQGNVGNYTRCCIALGIPTALVVGQPSNRHLYNAKWAWTAETLVAEARRIAAFVTPENPYWTPEEFWRPFWRLRGRIDLDPHSPDMPTVECLASYTRWQNGDLHGWFGIVWLNPSYDRKSLECFTEKVPRELASGRIELMAALLPYNPGTKREDMLRDTGAAIFHFHDRIRFGGLKIRAIFASILAVWGATEEELEQLQSTLPPNSRMKVPQSDAKSG
jgi:hypothetical protein